MQSLNKIFNGQLDLAIQIFTNKYKRPFFHQLISGQLDVDRMDYLSRDSFFTGVSEGVIGYERILKMVNVIDDELVVEEKGLNSVEKFLLARRLMYWQVYRHKTVVASENMLVKIIERAQFLFERADNEIKTNTQLDTFLGNFSGNIKDISLEAFCQLDDTDILFAIKQWQHHKDKVLSILCHGLLNRKCFSCQMQDKAISETDWNTAWQTAKERFQLDDTDLSYLCFKGSTSNTLYDVSDETIKILKKSGDITDITAIDNALINESLSSPVKKFYICLMKA
jgi:HD superfamily phosphohydrolase